MESALIHLRLNKEMKKDILDVVDSGHFTGITEFVKDAVRHSLEEYHRSAAIARLEKLKGSVKNIKRLTREERDRIARSLTVEKSREITKRYGLEGFRC